MKLRVNKFLVTNFVCQSESCNVLIISKITSQLLIVKAFRNFFII
jgi:hypothetical protein